MVLPILISTGHGPCLERKESSTYFYLYLMPAFFTTRLLTWHKANPRPLPWDGGPRDAYHVWVSEVIMQQTRIEQGAGYYTRFIKRFSDVHTLAAASVDEVLRYWQGLGYYTRARNLHKTATVVAKEHGGKFPRTYDELLQLPGVGPYSAAAIASFAYGLSQPVVDGNVKRVVARFAGIPEPVDWPSTHESIRGLAQKWMKGAPPGEFNQAIMNFGALVCKPKNPLCPSCPLQKKCQAFQNDLVDRLPARSKVKTNTVRYFHFVVIEYRGKVLLERREAKDIWQGLYAPPVLELATVRKPSSRQIVSWVESLTGSACTEQPASGDTVRQQLSHQTIHGCFHKVKLLSAPKHIPENKVWVTRKDLHLYGRPRMVVEQMSW